MTVSLNVTRHRLILGAQNATTGWYAATYEALAIEMIILPKGTSLMTSAGGVYAKQDALGITQELLREGDVIQASTTYYVITAKRDHYVGDCLFFREIDLTKLPFNTLTGTSETDVTVDDPRYRTRVYLNTYMTQLADVAWISVYGNPPNYPLERVFNDEAQDAIFTVGTPDSKPTVDWEGTVIGYVETVPIDIFTVDKITVAGTALRWKCEAELRRVVETYPVGVAYRSLSRMSDNERDMGGWKLYSVRYILTYQRDVT